MLVSSTVDLNQVRQEQHYSKNDSTPECSYYLISAGPKRSAGSSGRGGCFVACPEDVNKW